MFSGIQMYCTSTWWTSLLVASSKNSCVLSDGTYMSELVKWPIEGTLCPVFFLSVGKQPICLSVFFKTQTKNTLTKSSVCQVFLQIHSTNNEFAECLFLALGKKIGLMECPKVTLGKNIVCRVYSLPENWGRPSAHLFAESFFLSLTVNAILTERNRENYRQIKSLGSDYLQDIESTFWSPTQIQIKTYELKSCITSLDVQLLY